MITVTDENLKKFLHVEMKRQGRAMTVARYLDNLALSLWLGVGSEKFGWTESSDWRDDLLKAYFSMTEHIWNNEEGPSPELEQEAHTFVCAAMVCRAHLECR